jgi:hypothetical protein
MAKRPSIAEIVDTFSISNAMLIHALEQSGTLANVDFVQQLRAMAETDDKSASKRGRKSRKEEFHILRHVAALIEMSRNFPSRRRKAA